MRIAVCDDEAVCRAQLLDIATDYAEERQDKAVVFEYFSDPEALLKETEENGVVTYKTAPAADMQLPLEMQGAQDILHELQAIDVNTLTPIESMQILFDICNKAKSI